MTKNTPFIETATSTTAKRLTKPLLSILAGTALFALAACQASSSSEGDNPITPSPTPPTPTTLALTLKAPTAKVLTTNDAGNIEFQLEATGSFAAGESYALTLSTNAGILSKALFQTNLSAASLSAGKWSYATNANYAGLPEGDYGWRLIYSNTKGGAKGESPVVTNEGRFTFHYPPQAVSGLKAEPLEYKAKGETVPVRLSWSEPALKVINSGYQIFWSPSSGALEKVGIRVPAGTNQVVVLGISGTQYHYKIVTTNALGASHYAASSTENYPIPSSFFTLGLKAPTAKVLTTNAAGNIEFQLEATGRLPVGKSYALTLSTNAGALSRTLLQTNLSAASLTAGQWSYATNANYAGLPESDYGWRLEYADSTAASPPVATSGGFAFRYPPQAVTGLRAVTLETNLQGSGFNTMVQLSWTEPALKGTNSGYQVFWGTAGSVKNIGSNLPAGTSNVIAKAIPGANFNYSVVTTNALSAADPSRAASSSTLSYPVPYLVFELKKGSWVTVQQEKYLYGEANSITLNWQLSEKIQNHRGQQVWFGTTRGGMRPVTNLNAAARSVTLSSNVVGRTFGSRTVYYRLRGTNRTAVVDFDHFVSLVSCDAPENGFAMVCSRRSLEGVNAQLAGKYKLQNDINLGGREYTKAIIAPDTDDSSENHQGTAFSGSFDGNGKVIKNGSINGGNKHALGLFGKLHSATGVAAVVKNLGLQITVRGGKRVGSLAGEAGGVGGVSVITNVYSTGAVSGVSSAGGLVGYNNGMISNVYATGAVSGNSYLGGLVGVNDETGTISHSYATGAVSGSDLAVGGLLGANTGGRVVNTYATGAVTGSGSTGGLVGWMLPSGVISGVTTNGYATGTVARTTGSTQNTFGRVIGQLLGGSATNLYSSTAVASPGGAADPGAPTAVDFSNLDAGSVGTRFPTFDFDNIWKWSTTLRRPVLRGMPPGAEQ